MTIEHINIADNQRHEPRGASTASTNSVIHSNGDGTTVFKSVDYNNLINTPTIPPNYTQMTFQADSIATDVAGVVSDLNSLLAKLRSSGLMASS